MQPMLNIALRAARKAGDLIVRAGERLDRVSVQSKGQNDFVSDIDREAEAKIIDTLRATYPDHAFLGEESGDSGSDDSEYQWVIDPIDGTTNFLHGIPHYAVSLACLHKGRVEHAVIIDPCRQEEFTASRGQGAQLNGKRIRVSPRPGMDGALFATGIPYKGRNDDHMDAYMASLQAVASTSAGLRRAGSAALDLAYVAAGRVEGFWEVGLQRWDIATGVLIVREAGGLVCDFQGGNRYLDTGNIVSANGKLLKPLLQTLAPHLGHIK